MNWERIKAVVNALSILVLFLLLLGFLPFEIECDLLECLLLLFKPCWGMAILHPRKKSEERRNKAKEQALHLECTVEKCSPFKAWTVGVGQNIGMHAAPSVRMSYLFSVDFYLPCLFTFLFLPHHLCQLFNWNSFG